MKIYPNPNKLTEQDEIAARQLIRILRTKYSPTILSNLTNIPRSTVRSWFYQSRLPSKTSYQLLLTWHNCQLARQNDLRQNGNTPDATR